MVFLFDEFFIPRRIAAATVQGLRGDKANEGDLASMRLSGLLALIFHFAAIEESYGRARERRCQDRTDLLGLLTVARQYQLAGAANLGPVRLQTPENA